METDRTVLILVIAGVLLVVVGVFAWIVARSRRQFPRFPQGVAQYLEEAWTGTVAAVRQERRRPWYHTHPSLAAPRSLLYVQFRRDDGTTGTFVVARDAKTGEDDPDWAIRYNLQDAPSYQGRVPDQPPPFAEVAQRWKPGDRIEKKSGSFYPRLLG